MIAEIQKSLRNVGLLMVQRGSQIAAGLLFAVIVPRMMGPDVFGRYALIASVSLWFAMMSGLGSVSMMSRFVPQFIVRKEREGLEKLVSNMLVLRMTNGLLSASVYFLLTALWLRELDWSALAFIGGSILIRSGANLFYALFLGLNQAARWGMGEFIRRWTSLIFLIVGFRLNGLRGACFGLMLTELAVFSLGFWWGRSYLRVSELRIDRQFLAPFLRFSALFFASNMLLTITQRSGETLVKLISDDYVQVGYFGLAYSIYLTAAHAFWHLNIAFAPLLSMLLTQGNTEELKQLVERLLKWMGVVGMFAVFGALLLGENLTPMILGADYRPVALNLVPLSLALLTLALGNAGRILALTYDRPWEALKAALIQLTVFWCIMPNLIFLGVSLAGCIAVLISSGIYAAYFTWKMRADFHYSLKAWGAAIFLGALFLPLALIRSSFPVNAALYAAFAIGYSCLLFILRIVTWDELSALRKAFLRSRKSEVGSRR